MVLLVVRRTWVNLAVAVGAFVLAPSLPAAERIARPLSPEPLTGSAAVLWKGAQFARADQDGRVYFLHADALAVHRIEKDGTFGDPANLRPLGAPPTEVRDAAMDAFGGQWLLLASNTVHHFVDGQEKELPKLDDHAWGVGFLRATPLVSLVPSHSEHRSGSPPWLAQAGKDRWETLVDFSNVYKGDPLARSNRGDVIANTAVFVSSDRQGRLWAARQYAYRLEQYSRGGRRVAALTVGGGKVTRTDEKPSVIDLRKSAEGSSSPPSPPEENGESKLPAKATFRPFTAIAALLDVAAARDGRVYLLVQTSGGNLAVDRYSPAADLLERRELTLRANGRMSLAPGRDALYLAAWNGSAGRWRISWEQLDATEGWEEVETDEKAPAAAGASKAH